MSTTPGTPQPLADAERIIARAPTRICLVGGGTDVNPYASAQQGAILNVAIDRYHRVMITPRDDRRVLVNALGELRELDLDAPIVLGDDRRFDLVRAVVAHFQPRLRRGLGLAIDSDVPDSCGLGTSGSVGVALVGALRALLGDTLEPDAVARTAFELETDTLGWAGGKQDQWAAAHGGLCLTHFGPGEAVRVEPLADEDTRELLRRWLLLVHVGGQRASAALQVALQQGMRNNGQQRDALDELKALALQARAALEQRDLDHLGAICHRGWQAKKRSNPSVSTERIDAIYRAGREAGALGGKLIGAGGAGYLYFLCPPATQLAVLRAVGREAVTTIDFGFDSCGLRVSAAG